VLVTMVALYHVAGLVCPAFGEGGCALMTQEAQWKRESWEATVSTCEPRKYNSMINTAFE
jgi:hypothetical protein